MKNEISTVESTLKNPTRVVAFFSEMIETRANWEGEELARSNERLYSILKDCYEAGWKMNGVSRDAQAFKEAFRNFYEAQGVRFKSNTHQMVRIVRVVFGNEDRRRIHAYGTALKNMFIDKISPKDFIDYVKNAGGIEEIRRAVGRQKKTVSEMAEIGRAALNGSVLGAIQSESLDQQFEATSYVDAVVLVATREVDGTFVIRRMVQKESVVKVALASLSTEVQEEMVRTVTIQADRDFMSAREKAIEMAIAA